MALVSTESALNMGESGGALSFTTMNLTSTDACVMGKDQSSYGRTIRRMHTRDNVNVNDIDGTKPFHHSSALTTNMPFFHPVDDIPGTRPMALHRDLNKKDLTLRLDDIEGSRPKRNAFFNTTRCVNPLDPKYQLPSFTMQTVPVVPFLKDSMRLDDIPGAQHYDAPKRYFRKASIDDIEGAHAGWKPYHQRVRREAPPHDYTLNVKDITGQGFQTTRCTHPLAPTYTVNGMTVMDDPVKSKPRQLPRERDGPYFSLTTDDIEGAKPGWKPTIRMNPPLELRHDFGKTNFVGDIPGAQADTLRHSMRTKRVVNPLNPEYVGLDGEMLCNPCSPLYYNPSSGSTSHQKTGNHDEAAEVTSLSNKVTSTGTLSADVDTIEAQQVEKERVGKGGGGGGGVSKKQEQSRTTDDKDSRIRQLEAAIERLSRDKLRSSHSASSGDAGRAGLTTFCRNGNAIVCGGSSGGASQTTSPKTSGGGGGDSAAALFTNGFVAPKSSGSYRPLPSATRSAPNSGGDSRCNSVGIGSESARGNVYGALEILSRPNDCGGTDCGSGGSGVGGGSSAMTSSRRASAAQRLVLRSSNGMPRVTLTPQEKRAAKEYVDDIEGVRDLL